MSPPLDSRTTGCTPERSLGVAPPFACMLAAASHPPVRYLLVWHLLVWHRFLTGEPHTWQFRRAGILRFAFFASLLAVPVASGQVHRLKTGATQAGATQAEAQPAASQPISEETEMGELAQGDGDIELFELDVSLVVTATRREQKITTVPYAISVITAEDIRRSGARSIPDALRLVPGMDVADISYSNSVIGQRGNYGMVNRHVLVLVDGRQIFDSLFGGTLIGAWPFQLEDIERIEVIRGPGGVIWGANAVNGVVNVITKDPADQLGLTFSSSGGSRGSFKQHFGYGVHEGKLRLRISGEYEASDGFRKGGSFLRNLEDDPKSGRTGLHAIYEAGPDDTLTFSAGNALIDGGYSPPPTVGIGLTRNAGSQASFLLGKWARSIEDDNRFELIGYVNDFQFSPGIPAMDYRYQQLALQFSHTFVPTDAPAHTLIWGLDSRVDLLDATNADPFVMTKSYASTAIVGLYVQDTWRFAPRWTLDLGARIDYEFYGGFQPSARAALSYELGANSFVYGAVSRAFQMPPLGLRFLDLPLLNGIARAKGDRDLDSVTLIAYEIGYRGKFFDRLQTNLVLYWHEYDDQTTISPMLGPPSLIRYDIGNRASESIYGIEFDAEYQATNRLTLLGHYTFQLMDWRSSAPYHETDMVSPPKHKFMVGARYSPTDDLHLSSHLYYVDAVKSPNPANPFAPRHVPPYFRLDRYAEHELWDDRASFAVGVRNLLDSNHYEGGTMFLNDAEVPRMLFAEFRMTIR